jgi:hypothetical protein
MPPTCQDGAAHWRRPDRNRAAELGMAALIGAAGAPQLCYNPGTTIDGEGGTRSFGAPSEARLQEPHS